jgi:competence protein ComEC
LFANAIAIPVVSFIVTPLALVSGLIVLVPCGHHIAYWCLQLAHLSFKWMMVPVKMAADFDALIFDFPAVPVWAVVLAMLALILGLAPRGTPSKAIAWVCFFPLFLYKPSRPEMGHWTLTVADVGQAGAALLQTHRHNILFDTGLKMGDNDSVLRVILPMLRAQGIKVLDHVIVSHSDNDHAGGLVSLLKDMPVRRISSSFTLNDYINKYDKQKLLTVDSSSTDLCSAGQRWRIDGVEFEFLHPYPLTTDQIPMRPVKANALSCVLHIQGEHHSALLPGDIGEEQERAMLTQRDLRADAIIMPHHGSRTSSSWDFVQLVSAQHVIAQVARHNRFNHPDPAVVARWQSSGSRVWRTDSDGAVIVKSQGSSLVVSATRQTSVRYWHHH